jgi:FixJ family two-component response regulator
VESPEFVAVVDDDESVRDSLPDLLRSFGFDSQAYPSAEAFLRSDGLARTRCLVLDVAMPAMSGPELYRELRRRGRAIPVVFITAHSDPEFKLEALRREAVACLPKPFSEGAIVGAVRAAIGEGW